jgi:hypothetical protein
LQSQVTRLSYNTSSGGGVNLKMMPDPTTGEMTAGMEDEVTTLDDGSRQVVMRGGLDCNTEVGQATVTFGDRNESEPATFRVTAIDGGVGGGEANDSFEYTVFFDEEAAPLNYAIFGPKFTFTGQMIAGEVTIVDPNG